MMYVAETVRSSNTRASPPARSVLTIDATLPLEAPPPAARPNRLSTRRTYARAQQLRRGVDALRVRRIGFHVGLGGAAVEDKIGAVVDKDRTLVGSGPRQRANGKCIRVERVHRVILGAVHVVVRRAVDDHVWTFARHRRRHGRIVRHVERIPAEGDDLVTRFALTQNRGA